MYSKDFRQRPQPTSQEVHVRAAGIELVRPGRRLSLPPPHLGIAASCPAEALSGLCFHFCDTQASSRPLGYREGAPGMSVFYGSARARGQVDSKPGLGTTDVSRSPRFLAGCATLRSSFSVSSASPSLCCRLVAQSCLTVCDSMDCSPPGSSVHGISQARILEWGSFSGGPS